jgi:2,3-bisphosphoglycerate-dependent phosphoglycerate mutase
MRKTIRFLRNISLLLVVFYTQATWSQTTFVLLRHAEKQTENPRDKNPDLTAEGWARANDWLKVLQLPEVDAVYSTPFLRTKNTAQPWARVYRLDVQEYNPAANSPLDWITLSDKPQTFVIVGHSNTIPKLANSFIGSDFYADYPDAEYGSVIVVSGQPGSWQHFKINTEPFKKITDEKMVN